MNTDTHTHTHTQTHTHTLRDTHNYMSIYKTHRFQDLKMEIDKEMFK